MNDIKKMQQLIDKKKYNELTVLIDDCIDEVKSVLHDDNPQKLDVSKVYDFTMRCGKIATILSEAVTTNKDRYMFNGGYFTAEVEELEFFLDKLERIKENEQIYKKLSGKKYYLDILRILYTRDLVQSKIIAAELTIRPNYLTKIMKELLKYNIIVSYEFSKYKYYGLTWDMKKYLDYIGLQKYNHENTQKDFKLLDMYTDCYLLKNQRSTDNTWTKKKDERIKKKDERIKKKKAYFSSYNERGGKNITSICLHDDVRKYLLSTYVGNNYCDATKMNYSDEENKLEWFNGLEVKEVRKSRFNRAFDSQGVIWEDDGGNDRVYYSVEPGLSDKYISDKELNEVSYL